MVQPSDVMTKELHQELPLNDCKEQRQNIQTLKQLVGYGFYIISTYRHSIIPVDTGLVANIRLVLIIRGMVKLARSLHYLEQMCPTWVVMYVYSLLYVYIYSKVEVKR